MTPMPNCVPFSTIWQSSLASDRMNPVRFIVCPDTIAQGEPARTRCAQAYLSRLDGFGNSADGFGQFRTGGSQIAALGSWTSQHCEDVV